MLVIHAQNPFCSLLHVQLPFLEHAYFEFLMNRNGFNVRTQRTNQAFFACDKGRRMLRRPISPWDRSVECKTIYE